MSNLIQLSSSTFVPPEPNNPPEPEFDENKTVGATVNKQRIAQEKKANKQNISPKAIEINNRINQEVCHSTRQLLSDESLLEEYKKTESVKNKILQFRKMLDRHIDDETTKNKIVSDYLINIVPAGTKGVIRGNKFNAIVKEYLVNLRLDPSIYTIKFESQYEGHIMSEKPDWYILNKLTNKVIIGMNQVALWGGGQQNNRGSKYISIDNTHNTEMCKLLCVVCDYIQFKSFNKDMQLFDTGFATNTLCYLNGLQKNIVSFLQ
jgi:hypothetical protein